MIIPTIATKELHSLTRYEIYKRRAGDGDSSNALNISTACASTATIYLIVKLSQLLAVTLSKESLYSLSITTILGPYFSDLCKTISSKHLPLYCSVPAIRVINEIGHLFEKNSYSLVVRQLLEIQEDLISSSTFIDVSSS